MSISKLPDPLIANIANYLRYSDICNLMETNINNYNIIKGYKKNKVKLYSLRLYDSSVNACDVSLQYFHTSWDDIEKNMDQVKQVLDKCSSIDEVHIEIDGEITNELIDVLKNTKAKFGTLYVLWKHFFTIEYMINLGRKINMVFLFVDIEPDIAFLNDEFLTKILPCSSIHKSSRTEIGTKTDSLNITDRTLNALIGGNMVPNKFYIECVYNYITIKGLVNVIKILLDREVGRHLTWKLGILQPNQAADAARYFGENGEMRAVCKVQIREREDFLFYTIEDTDAAKFYITVGFDYE